VIFFLWVTEVAMPHTCPNKDSLLSTALKRGILRSKG
jgi:hypothetical protein